MNLSRSFLALFICETMSSLNLLFRFQCVDLCGLVLPSVVEDPWLL